MTADTARTLPREGTATGSAPVSVVGHDDGSVSVYSDGVRRVRQPTHDPPRSRGISHTKGDDRRFPARTRKSMLVALASAWLAMLVATTPVLWA